MRPVHGENIQRLFPRVKSGFMLVVIALLISGCSATRLAYYNADWLLKSAVNDYIDFTGSQSKSLSAALDRHLDWHCSTQLPAYVRWLTDVEKTALSEDVQRQEIETRVEELKGHVDAILREIAPTTADLLKQLDDDQLQEFSSAMAAKQAEMHEEYAEPPLQRQIEERAARLEERLDRWLGELTEPQRERILQWSRSRGDQNRYWLENRGQWQQSLLHATKQRHDAEFGVKIADLLLSPEQVHTAAWQTRSLSAREEAIDLTLDLLRLATPQQKQHLQKAIQHLRRDFESLTCEA